MPDIISMQLLIHKTAKSDPVKAKEYVDALSSKAADILLNEGVSPKDITSDSIRVETVYKHDRQGGKVVTGKKSVEILT